jgi:hypothetical protein
LDFFAGITLYPKSKNVKLKQLEIKKQNWRRNFATIDLACPPTCLHGGFLA